MRQTLRELAEAMADSLNVFSSRVERLAFVEAMAGQHRTLQQLFTGLALAWLKYVADLPESGVDGRNEYSRKIARVLLRREAPSGPHAHGGPVEDWELNPPLV